MPALKEIRECTSSTLPACECSKGHESDPVAKNNSDRTIPAVASTEFDSNLEVLDGDTLSKDNLDLDTCMEEETKELKEYELSLAPLEVM